MDPHEALEKEQAAAAAVSALYFLCFFGSAFNVKLTGFRLYIPVSMAALGELSRLTWVSTHQPDVWYCPCTAV